MEAHDGRSSPWHPLYAQGFLHSSRTFGLGMRARAPGMEAAPARRAPRAARRETSDSMAMVMPQLRVAACNQSTIQQPRSRCHNLDAPSRAFHFRYTSLVPKNVPASPHPRGTATKRAADALKTEAAVLHPAHSGWCSSHPAPSIVSDPTLDADVFRVCCAHATRTRCASLAARQLQLPGS